MVVASGSGETDEGLAKVGDGGKKVAHLHLAHLLGQLVVGFQLDALRHVGIEFVERTYTHNVEHLLDVLLRMRKISMLHVALLFAEFLVFFGVHQVVEL